MTVNVLGAEWQIINSDPTQHPILKRCDGFCDYTTHEILMHPLTSDRDDVEISDADVANKRIRRHELIHAFLFESGLSYDAQWPMNEAMVDYFARQFPKMLKTFQEAGAI